MRIMRRGWGLGSLVAAGLILSNGALRAEDQPVVHVKAVVKNGAVRLQAEANAPLEYTTYRPSENLYVVELGGVSTTDPSGARNVASDLVKSYRLVPYSVGNKPMVRVEILMSKGVDPQVQRNDSNDLDLVVSRTTIANSVSTPADGKAVGRSAASCRLRDVISDAASFRVTPAFSLPMHWRTLRGSRLVAGSWSGVQISTALNVGVVARN